MQVIAHLRARFDRGERWEVSRPQKVWSPFEEEMGVRFQWHHSGCANMRSAPHAISMSPGATLLAGWNHALPVLCVIGSYALPHVVSPTATLAGWQLGGGRAQSGQHTILVQALPFRNV